MKDERIKKKESGISFRLLGGLIIAFLAGMIIAQIIANISSKETIQFSTIALVVFLFSVLLAGASIVLSITAILLGKQSEQTMIDRSVESINLQTDIFTKTTAALQKIEASTGVTEKRIEDIISGRIGDISYSLADTTMGKSAGFKDIGALEENIKESIMRELKSKESREVDRKKAQEHEKRYEKYQKDILVACANIEAAKLERMESGSFDATGDKLFDGIFNIQNKRVGISTLTPHHIAFAKRSGYLFKVAHEILKGNVNKVFLVFDDKDENLENIRKEFSHDLETLKETAVNALSFITANEKSVEQKILKNL